MDMISLLHLFKKYWSHKQLFHNFTDSEIRVMMFKKTSLVLKKRSIKKK